MIDSVAIPVSQTFEEAEDLVQRLYQPGSAREYTRIDTCLKELQKSEQGFRLADALLSSQHANVRFFGALTFTIKINRDWKTLNEQTSRELLHRLLHWFIHAVAHQDSALVIRKLSAALTAAFQQSLGQWKNPIRHVLCSLYAKNVVEEAAIASNHGISDLLAAAKTHELVALLWFATSLVESVETSGTDTSSTTGIAEAFFAETPDMMLLIHYSLTQGEADNDKAALAAVRFYQTLVSTAQRHTLPNVDVLGQLRALVSTMVELLRQERLFETIADALSDIMANFKSFFTVTQYEAIALALMNQVAQQRLPSLLHGDFEVENLAFTRLVLAYGEARVDDLAYRIHQPLNEQVLRLLAQLAQCDGDAVADDTIASQVLDFWAAFAELVLDASDAEGIPDRAVWKNSVTHLLQTVTQSFLQKVKMPPEQVYAEWDRDTRFEFQDFRRDFQHFAASAYICLGSSLFEQCIIHITEAWGQRDWRTAEAAMLCLNGFSITIEGNDGNDALLTRLFELRIFQDLIGTEIPRQTQQTALKLIGHYPEYFRRHAASLEPVIDFLFRCLDQSSLAMVAAKTIHNLCLTCRTDLARIAAGFSKRFSALSGFAREAIEVRPRLAGAAAALVQGLATSESADNASSAPKLLEQLIDGFAADLRILENKPTITETEAEVVMACLVSMGKAYRSPEITVIVLDDPMPHSTSSSSDFQVAQDKLVELVLLILQTHPQNGAVHESACELIRTGLTESIGPFVLSFPHIENITTLVIQGNQRVGLALETLVRVLRKRSLGGPLTDVELACLRHFVANAFSLLGILQGDPSNDPEIAAGVIDYLQACIPSYARLLLEVDLQYLEDLLRFSLRCLASAEILPKKAAEAFWVKLLQDDSTDEAISAAVTQIIETCGAELATVLVYGIGGQASRSELDGLADPLRKLVFRGGHARAWLAAALESQDFPSTRVTAADKRSFLASIMHLRGAAGTNKIVKAFWVSCRGTFTV